ncbi:hypothetical protein LEP1GSC171_3364 [Leptospira santarosai str. HAI1380]|nr:hypothetical protein LEP1GSC163_3872 [Leptospira santarosai str. CBC379]EMJ47153.1 hypothetical protein LEP1GSC169_3791 [Leptospira santarosai str. HAI1349]EMO22471.1 hypothetical protein LEP1GSC168_2175 [Leptospira santarosai str. HAI134]EMP01166.1 hypothetical protein LEP1GSC171_3364 [Leptospira santarosai str. HAI1380]EMP80568.1 hypothetical protein LEP1GSC162_3634 [Leptospira santarosai str. CBC1531]
MNFSFGESAGKQSPYRNLILRSVIFGFYRDLIKALECKSF